MKNKERKPLPKILFNGDYIETPEDKMINPKDKNNNPCILKAKVGEPLFVLRATDVSSPKVILHWIAKNFETAPEEKLKDALETALEMKKYPHRKEAD